MTHVILIILSLFFSMINLGLYHRTGSKVSLSVSIFGVVAAAIGTVRYVLT